ncbi:NSS family neurotransmitter:Na+ symporter [Chitinivorax tropicus]|uniref:Transporter n=1 Tax=Chitinivorax tropicus TaxID=714531 RepID=A0A840MKI5_9PROT|nr:sodium-dependent transporter [Chitinivorax tropicus]MBB5017076.1 NSS family neurotransmitter:Na+ symporter [Chitinivorax tropicus]
MQRATWGSKLGFILASAGSAVGLGCIWKFPYVTASNGGGAFLLVFLAFAFTLGLALMKLELALGRAGRAGIVGTFKQLGGKHWRWVGIPTVLGCLIIMMFYGVVGGWTIAHIKMTLFGELSTTNTAKLSSAFSEFIKQPVTPIIYHGLFLALTLGVVIGGVQQGIERLSKLLMPLLFILMLLLIVRGVTLPGGWKGVEFMFNPDFSKLTIDGVINAMGLAFFSLSLGMGVMITYGSYIDEHTHIPGTAMWIVGLAVMACLLGGLMVLPPVFAFDMNPGQGPGLTFISMPAVFAHMPGGVLFGTAFFTLLLVAALTSSVSLLEVAVSYFVDELKWSRRMASIVPSVLMLIGGIPASLSFGPWSDVKLFNMTIFDLMDYLTSNIMLPLGGVVTALFGGWVAWKTVEKQLAHGNQLPAFAMQTIRFTVSWVAPVVISVVLLKGL